MYVSRGVHHHHHFRTSQNETCCDRGVAAIKEIFNTTLYGAAAGGSQALLSWSVGTGAKIFFSGFTNTGFGSVGELAFRVSYAVGGFMTAQLAFSTVLAFEEKSKCKIVGTSLGILGASALLTGAFPAMTGGFLGYMNSWWFTSGAVPLSAALNLWFELPQGSSLKTALRYLTTCGLCGFLAHSASSFSKNVLGKDYKQKIVPRAVEIVTTAVAFGSLQAGQPSLFPLVKEINLNNSYLYLILGAIGALVGKGIEAAAQFLNL